MWTDEPECAQRFARAKGRTHMSDAETGLQRWFASQYLKWMGAAPRGGVVVAEGARLVGTRSALGRVPRLVL